MLDIIFRSLSSVDSLGTVNLTPWYTSQSNASNIVFGDSCTWLIGLGRITNIFGPDLKVVADWNFIYDIANIKPGSGSGWAKAINVVSGSRGTTDLILGGKDVFNYGKHTSYAVTRSRYPQQKIEISQWKKNEEGDWDINDDWFPNKIKLTIYLPYILILSSVVTSRLAYMQLGIFANENVRSMLQKILITAVPLVESRWVVLIKIMEQMIELQKTLKKETNNVKGLSGELIENTKNTSTNVLNYAKSSVVCQNTSNERPLISDKQSNDLDDSKKSIKNTLEKVVHSTNLLTGGVPGLENIVYQKESSSSSKIANSTSYSYEAETEIKFTVKQEEENKLDNQLIQEQGTASFVQITPNRVKASTPIGSINVGENANGVDIWVNSDDKKSAIQLRHSGGNRSQLNIYPNSLEMQSGKNAASAPSISFADGKLTLRTGEAVIGPSITLTNDKIEMSIGPPLGGSKISMTSASFDISVGESTLSLTPTGIEQKVGDIVINKLGLLKQELKSAENNITLAMGKLVEKVINVNTKIEAIDKLTRTLADYQTNAIEAEKATLNKKN